MSTLVTNTITGLSTAANITIGSTPVVSASANSLTIRGEGSAQTSVQQGIAKGWFEVGDDFALDDSFNISGTTDDGTGLMDYAYTTNMASANYSALGGSAGGARNTTFILIETSGNATTGSELSAGTSANGGTINLADVGACTTIHGDLA